MITITSYQTLGADRAENSIEPAQIFKIRIPDSDIRELAFDDKELELFERAANGDMSPRLMLRILNMLVDKIERRKDLMKANPESKNG